MDLRNDQQKHLKYQGVMEWSISAGQPYEELIKYAVVNNVDLIVLGVLGHSLAEMLFVGSTTDRVVRQAPCPVLSVRPMAQGK